MGLLGEETVTLRDSKILVLAVVILCAVTSTSNNFSGLQNNHLLYAYVEGNVYSVKSKIINMLGFSGYIVSVRTPQLCYLSTKAAIDNKCMNGYVYVQERI